jgi:hypothetical protein
LDGGGRKQACAVVTLGAAEVVRQLADGHTLLSVTAPIAAAPALLPSAKLQIETDFASSELTDCSTGGQAGAGQNTPVTLQKPTLPVYISLSPFRLA